MNRRSFLQTAAAFLAAAGLRRPEQPLLEAPKYALTKVSRGSARSSAAHVQWGAIIQVEAAEPLRQGQAVVAVGRTPNGVLRVAVADYEWDPLAHTREFVGVVCEDTPHFGQALAQTSWRYRG